MSSDKRISKHLGWYKGKMVSTIYFNFIFIDLSWENFYPDKYNNDLSGRYLFLWSTKCVQSKHGPCGKCTTICQWSRPRHRCCHGKSFLQWLGSWGGWILWGAFHYIALWHFPGSVSWDKHSVAGMDEYLNPALSKPRRGIENWRQRHDLCLHLPVKSGRNGFTSGFSIFLCTSFWEST